MFTDERRYEVWEEIRQSDLTAFQDLLPDSLLREAGCRANVKVIKCPLCGANLVWLGIVSALQNALSFASVLTLTVRMLNLSANGLPEPIVAAQRKQKRNAKRRKQKRNTPDTPGTCGTDRSRQRQVFA